MTNNQSMQETAISLLEAGKLNSFEAQFVESIRNWTKKDLNRISSRQYEILKKISQKG